MSAIYSIYTSPNHAPVPDHLPTLIVTPHGRPAHILYTFLHTNLNSENYLLTPSDAGDLCVAKLFPPPGNGGSRGSKAHDGSHQPVVRCEASRNLRWSITNTGIQTPVYKLTLPNPDQPQQDQPLFQVSKPNPNAPYWSLFYFTYAGHLIPPKRVEFGRIQKNSPESGGGTRVTITGKTEEEKAVWATLGEGNEDMVEWIVVGAALTVLDDEIIQAAERAGVPLSAGPPGQPRMPQQQQPRQGPPRGPPTRQPTLPPQMQQQQRQGPPPQQLMPGQRPPQQQQQQRGPPSDPRMMDPRLAQQQQDPRMTGRQDPRTQPPQQQQSRYDQGQPGVAYGEMPQPQQPQYHHQPPPQQQQHQQVRHQLRDEPQASAGGYPQPPQQRSHMPGREQAPAGTKSPRPDLPALDTLKLQDNNGALPSPTQPHSAAREYAAMAVTSPTGYQPEPLPAGYEPAKPTPVMSQPQGGYQSDPRREPTSSANGRSSGGVADPRSDPRYRAQQQQHNQRDPYGAASSSNGHSNRQPPQHQPSLPPQAAQAPVQRSAAPPARAPSPPRAPRSPPPPDPKDPAFLHWVASREEHKWPEEAGAAQAHQVPSGSRNSGGGGGAYLGGGAPPQRMASVRAPGMPQVMGSPTKGRGMLQKQRAAR